MLPEQIFLELSDSLERSTNFVVFIPIFIVFGFTHWKSKPSLTF